MILKRLTASFGSLDHAELSFQEGLNVISAPNEAGKSTWSAFLLAMFYGIDTGERAKAGHLPAKTKYRPWSGAPMEGRMELVWNGRNITIERTSSGRTPMGKFRAYETQSGLDIPELTADNCGVKLLGVERSVFERSAFIHQNGMAITADGTLEQRLRDLVTTADETVSYDDTAQTLRNLRNRCMSNRANGLIPQTREQLANVEQRLEEIHQLHRSDLNLQAQRAELTAQIAQLEQQLQSQLEQQAVQQRRQLDAASAALAQAQRRYQEAKQSSDGLPGLAVLQTLRQQWHDISQSCYSIATLPEAPVAPEVPRGFTDAASAQAQAAVDVETMNPPPDTARSPLFLILAVLSFLLGTVLLVFQSLLGLIPLACGVLFIGLELLKRQKSNRAAQAHAMQVAAIAARYGTTDREEILRTAAEYAARQSVYMAQHARYVQDCETIRAQQDLANAQLDRCLQKIHEILPGAQDPESALEHAMERCRWTKTAADAVSAAQRQLEALQAAVGTLSDTPELISPSTATGPSAAPLRQMHSQLQQLTSILAQHTGRAAAIGDPAMLTAQREQLQEQLSKLEFEYEAIDLAMQTLEQAETVLQTQFSPQITKTAGRFIKQMTQSRYDTVQLEKGMSISAREAGGIATHPVAALSGGTMDQMYLAVRLAICEHVLPAETPLVLDDALVYFDDVRMAQALELLQTLSQTRQVLLFSCQTREAAWQKQIN